MTRTNLSMSISADGYVVNLQVVSDMMDDMGATIMGRNMFGPIRGEWANSDWKGWWGDVPPYHCPVFVLTHYPRDPIEMEGGTTFHFVTDGIESAYARAKAAAGGRIYATLSGLRESASGFEGLVQMGIVPTSYSVRSAGVFVVGPVEDDMAPGGPAVVSVDFRPVVDQGKPVVAEFLFVDDRVANHLFTEAGHEVAP